jgi:hypothetical protein
VTEWELWACAQQLVKQHGRGAVMKAAERMFEFEAAGDVEGHSAWVMILQRIVKLLRKTSEPGDTVQ